jgi:hypothetical protein
MTTVRSDAVLVTEPRSSSAVAAETLLARQPKNTAAAAQVVTTVCLVELMALASLMTEKATGHAVDVARVVPVNGIEENHDIAEDHPDQPGVLGERDEHREERIGERRP